MLSSPHAVGRVPVEEEEEQVPEGQALSRKEDGQPVRQQTMKTDLRPLLFLFFTQAF